MANAPFFWKIIHKSYIASPVANEDAYQNKLTATQSKLKPDHHILEIGCGSGNTAITHAPFVAKVTATDFCGPMMDHGRARVAAEAIENVEFKELSIWDIPEDTQYDAVLMMSVIHLIPDWKGAIEKATRLLKPGGWLITSTVTTADQPFLSRLVGQIVNVAPIMPSLVSMSFDDLVAQMTQNGLVLDPPYHPDNGTSVFIMAQKPTS